jgi:hypothetical protein
MLTNSLFKTNVPVTVFEQFPQDSSKLIDIVIEIVLKQYIEKIIKIL